MSSPSLSGEVLRFFESQFSQLQSGNINTPPFMGLGDFHCNNLSLTLNYSDRKI